MDLIALGDPGSIVEFALHQLCQGSGIPLELPDSPAENRAKMLHRIGGYSRERLFFL
jgi:hypothetical protein